MYIHIHQKKRKHSHKHINVITFRNVYIGMCVGVCVCVLNPYLHKFLKDQKVKIGF